MSQQLLITITAKDGASTTFRSVGSSATAMGSALKTAASGAGASLDKVSTSSTKAAQSMDKLEAESKGAARGLDDLESKAVKVGAALGTAVGFISRFGAQAENQRRQVDGIRKAYGDAADEILEYTETLQDSTKFSNEDARQAAQIAATLAQNYGFTAEEVQKLIDVSANLATIHGTTLSDAVQRTSSAMRGEAESAEMLGLTLNQAAIDRENVTLSMSNEEAAHFRLNALLEQSAFAEGAAGEAAATAAGQSAQFGNAIQDITTNIGAALGPIGGATAGLADMALIFPVIGAGIGKVASAMPKLSGGLSKIGGLVGAINPVGLAIGALAVGAGLVIKAWSDNEAANANLSASYDELSAAIRETQSAQQQMLSSDIRFDFGLDEQMKSLQELGRLDGFTGFDEDISRLTLSTEELTKANQLLGESFRQVETDGMDSLISAMNRLETQTESFAVTGDTAISALTELNEALSYNGDGAEIVDAAVQRLNDAYSAGNITATEYAAGLAYLNDNMADIVAGTQEVTAATEDLTKAQQAALRFATEQGLEGQSARLNALAETYGKLTDAAAESAMAQGQGFAGDIGAATEEAAAYGERLDGLRQNAIEAAGALREQLVPGIDGASDAMMTMAKPGEDILDLLDRIAPTASNVGGSLLQLADGLNDAAQGMQGVLSVFESIDSLGGVAESAAGIAEELVGAVGEMATIDDLLASGAISQRDYNAAVEAGYGIQAKNVLIQEDLNAIRAQQLPLLDQQAASYRAYIDRLAEASTAEQQHALYLLDSANQAKVAASFSTAYAGALGEIPTEVATEIIASGAQADPILADVLEKMGLIEVGANGEISINFPNASTLTDVTESIDRLNNTVVEVGIATTGDETLRENLVEIEEKTNELDGKTATVTTAANDTATATVQEASAEVDAFDGKTATATIGVKLDAGLASGAGFGAALESSAPEDITVTISAEDNATATINAVSAKLSGLDGTSATATLGATDNATSVIDGAADAASGLTAITYIAKLSASDGASNVITGAQNAADLFVNTYTADIQATDNASSIIATPQSAADSFAAITYIAQLSASDGASGTISGAQSAATSFASTYTASLAASDSASGVINSIAASLANLDGSSATVYINAVDNTGGATARKLGGAILPAAKLGRVVQVGEAGPEAVVLPYGAMVQPSPASQSFLPQELGQPPSAPPTAQASREKPPKPERTLDEIMPDGVNMKEAYRKGGDSAKAFYDGLIDEVQGLADSKLAEISSTVYGSKEEADAALKEYTDFIRKRNQLERKREKAKDFDKDVRAAEKAAARIEKEFDNAEAAMTKSGERAGKGFDKGVSAGADAGKAAMEKFSQYLDTVDQQETSPEIAIDTKKATENIDDVSTGLTSLDSQNATVDVKVNRKAFDEFLADVEAAKLGVTVVVSTKDKSEKKLGGAVLADDVPHAALGRIVTVGEAGQETVVLPYGSMVVPHPASAARNAAEPRGGQNFYGPVNIYPPTPDLYGAITSQATGAGRG